MFGKNITKAASAQRAELRRHRLGLGTVGHQHDGAHERVARERAQEERCAAAIGGAARGCTEGGPLFEFDIQGTEGAARAGRRPACGPVLQGEESTLA